MIKAENNGLILAQTGKKKKPLSQSRGSHHVYLDETSSELLNATFGTWVRNKQ